MTIFDMIIPCKALHCRSHRGIGWREGSQGRLRLFLQFCPPRGASGVCEGGGLGPVEHSEIPQIATVSQSQIATVSQSQIATVSAILTYVWMPSLCLASP